MKYTRLQSSRALAAACALALAASLAHASDDPFDSPESLGGFAEELEFFKVESDVVTSVSRTPESLWGAAAAVYVVTADDIERSGARTFPDALRMVPGLDVAAIDANLQAMSARGFNNFFADKMLVLLDGRPIYTAEFGGVFWHQWNTFLPDVERIEVIRGPGGTLWGSNAVNGVINITTKSAEDTQGGHVRTTGGDNNTLDVEARWGGKVGDFHYRIYGRQVTSDGFGGDAGDDQFDEADETRAGYRFDWDLGDGFRFSSSAELYNGRIGSTNFGPNPLDPATVAPLDFGNKLKTDLYSGIFRLEKDFASGDHAYFQAGITYADRLLPFLGLMPAPAFGFAGDRLSSRRRSADLEFGHNFRPNERTQVTWGLTYHRTNIDMNDSALVQFPFGDDDDILDNVGGFAQGRIRLWEGGELTIGTKVEWNTFTDWNVQPSVRLAHRASEDTTVWGSISRAVNTPSFGDNFVVAALADDTTSIPGATVTPIFTGSESVDNTVLTAYEAGLRHRFNNQVSLDLAGFYNDYEDFAGWNGADVTTVMVAPGRFVTTSVIDNSADAYGYGVEAVLSLSLNDRVRAEVNGTWQRVQYLGNRNPQIPEFKFNFRPEFDLSETVQFVPTIHYVDDVDTPLPFTPTLGSVPTDSYVRVDAALHWSPSPDLPKLSFIWQNLQTETHSETVDLLVRPTGGEITRAWFVRASYEF